MNYGDVKDMYEGFLYSKKPNTLADKYKAQIPTLTHNILGHNPAPYRIAQGCREQKMLLPFVILHFRFDSMASQDIHLVCRLQKTNSTTQRKQIKEEIIWFEVFFMSSRCQMDLDNVDVSGIIKGVDLIEFDDEMDGGCWCKRNRQAIAYTPYFLCMIEG